MPLEPRDLAVSNRVEEENNEVCRFLLILDFNTAAVILVTRLRLASSHPKTSLVRGRGCADEAIPQLSICDAVDQPHRNTPIDLLVARRLRTSGWERRLEFKWRIRT